MCKLKLSKSTIKLEPTSTARLEQDSKLNIGIALEQGTHTRYICGKFQLQKQFIILINLYQRNLISPALHTELVVIMDEFFVEADEKKLQTHIFSFVRLQYFLRILSFASRASTASRSFMLNNKSRRNGYWLENNVDKNVVQLFFSEMKNYPAVRVCLYASR